MCNTMNIQRSFRKEHSIHPREDKTNDTCVEGRRQVLRGGEHRGCTYNTFNGCSRSDKSQKYWLTEKATARRMEYKQCVEPLFGTQRVLHHKCKILIWIHGVTRVFVSVQWRQVFVLVVCNNDTIDTAGLFETAPYWVLVDYLLYCTL